MTDIYTKCVLTFIAGALAAIAINLTLRLDPPLAFLGNGPTFGDWLSAVKDEDPSTIPFDIVKQAPLVAVCDGARCLKWSR